ncbi:MAG TPA: DNA polymerase III subunit gamma/tau, partial [Pantoea sp.]|nr:DNA polymerase III subunit gamma/tau [Pantoea sp.]
IESETRALQLLARAADGSMRDALSLTDQAIAMGQGAVTSSTVSVMLGTLDDEQPLGLLEALVDGNGQQVMNLLSQAASRGVEWEALLVEMLRLLHQIAMVQLLPASLNDDDESNAIRLRELARVVPPADLQLYYQTLLMGRKDLPIAPDRRMGVEMTLLRALAFHPKAAVAEPIARPVLTEQMASVAPAPTSLTPSGPSPVARHTTAQPATPSPAQTRSPVAQQPMPASQQQVAAQPQMAAPDPALQPAPPPDAAPDTALSSSTSQLLQARTQLLRQGANKPKKSEPAAPGARPANSALERLASVTERSQQRIRDREPAVPVKEEAYRWKAVNQPVEVAEPVATP